MGAAGRRHARNGSVLKVQRAHEGDHGGDYETLSVDGDSLANQIHRSPAVTSFLLGTNPTGSPDLDSIIPAVVTRLSFVGPRNAGKLWRRSGANLGIFFRLPARGPWRAQRKLRPTRYTCLTLGKERAEPIAQSDSQGQLAFVLEGAQDDTTDINRTIASESKRRLELRQLCVAVTMQTTRSYYRPSIFMRGILSVIRRATNIPSIPFA